jgi:hypothetical protein
MQLNSKFEYGAYIFLTSTATLTLECVGKSGIASNALNCVCSDISFIIFLEKNQISSRIIEFEIWIVIGDLF